MKKFFLIGLLTLMAFMTNGLQASDGVKYLIVHLQDGQKVTFPLADEPVITVADNVLTVKTPEQQISVPFENLVNYLLSDKSGIDAPQNEDPDYALNHDRISFSGLNPYSCVDVFKIDGTHMAIVMADSSGYAAVDISGFAADVYVVKYAGGSFKFRKN